MGLLDEATARNRGLETLADEGLGAFERANPLVRMFVLDMVRRGVGMSLDDLRRELREMSELFGDLRDGRTTIDRERDRLTHYAGVVRRTASFVEGLEPMTGRIKDPANRERVVALARTHLADAHRLAEILDRLRDS